jgi:RNA polymerase sigma-70 factor (ECF subfamily)
LPSRKDLLRSELLAIQYRRGDSEAMDELVLIWQDPLYYYVRRLIPDDEEALDVMQDVWLRVLRRFRQLRNPAAFPAWLFQVARSVAYGRVRKSRREEARVLDHLPSPEEEADDHDPLAIFTAERVHHALTKVSVAHRDCLTLRFIEGFSLAEVSQIVGVPVGTVKSRLHHAKKALRRVLEEESS